jgi:hypothetical protein
LFNLLIRAQGSDRFYFYIPNEHGLAQIDFPNNTTNYAQVQDALYALAGGWATISVE